jgi:hypothetical protein
MNIQVMPGFYYFAKAGVLSFQQIADFSYKNVTIPPISSAKKNILLMELNIYTNNLKFFNYKSFHFWSSKTWI